jgi:hypothetical protein
MPTHGREVVGAQQWCFPHLLKFDLRVVGLGNAWQLVHQHDDATDCAPLVDPWSAHHPRKGIDHDHVVRKYVELLAKARCRGLLVSHRRGTRHDFVDVYALRP